MCGQYFVEIKKREQYCPIMEARLLLSRAGLDLRSGVTRIVLLNETSFKENIKD